MHLQLYYARLLKTHDSNEQYGYYVILSDKLLDILTLLRAGGGGWAVHTILDLFNFGSFHAGSVTNIIG